MSFTISVYVNEIPSDLLSRWRTSLSKRGFDFDFYPAFDPTAWGGGLVPLGMQVPGAIPASARYGPEPVLTGFEFAATDIEEDERDPSGLPANVAEALGRAAKGLHFRSAAGRTVSEFRALILSAAAVAEVTNGAYLDGQDEAYHVGSAAYDHAIAAADRYESIPELREEEWSMTPFKGWEDYERQHRAWLDQGGG